MNDMSINTRVTIGDNNPPIDVQLSTKYEEDLKRYEELLEKAKSAPSEIVDDESQNAAAEFVKALRALELRFEHVTKDEKAPYETIVANIRGFFNTKIDKLEAIRTPLKKKCTEYLDKKKVEEQRRLAAEEERKRAEAAEKLRLATEAEQTSKAAQAAVDLAKSAAEDAQAARDAATTEVEIATADVAQAKAELQQLRADIAKVNADFAQRAKDGNPAPQEERAAKSAEFNAKVTASKAKLEAAETILKTARDAAAKAKAALIEKERAQREEESKVRTAEREQKAHEEAAEKTEREANRIASKIEGSAADLTRTRSEHGAVSGLSGRWTCEVQDKNLLDKEALWPFIHEDAIQSALWKWMQVQPDNKESRKMAGAYMAREESAQIR